MSISPKQCKNTKEDTTVLCVEDSVCDLEAKLKRLEGIRENDENKNNFIVALGLIGCVVLIAAFSLTMTGVIDLRNINNMIVPIYTTNLFNFAMFMANMYFLFSITLRIFDKQILFVLLGYVPIYWLLFIFSPFEMFSTIIAPILYVVAVSTIKKTFKNTFTNVFVFCLINFLYQVFSGVVKTYGFSLVYNHCNIYTMILLSIDMYLFLLFYRWVVINNVVVCSSKLYVFSKNKSVCETCKSSEEDVIDSFNKKQKIIFSVLAIGYQAIQLITVLLIGKFNNVFVELLVMLFTFWIGRSLLGKCWHSSKLWICSCTTFVGFYILTKLTLPFNVSLFSSITLSGIFTYFLYYIGIKQEEFERYEIICNEETMFRKHCKDVGFSEVLTEIAVDYKLNKLSVQSQSEKMGYSLKTIKNYRTKINKKI